MLAIWSMSKLRSCFNDYRAIVKFVSWLSSWKRTLTSCKNSCWFRGYIILMPNVSRESTGRLEIIGILLNFDSLSSLSSICEGLANFLVSNLHETTIPSISPWIKAFDCVSSILQFAMFLVYFVISMVWSTTADNTSVLAKYLPRNFTAPNSSVEVNISWGKWSQESKNVWFHLNYNIY